MMTYKYYRICRAARAEVIMLLPFISNPFHPLSPKPSARIMRERALSRWTIKTIMVISCHTAQLSFLALSFSSIDILFVCCTMVLWVVRYHTSTPHTQALWRWRFRWHPVHTLVWITQSLKFIVQSFCPFSNWNNLLFRHRPASNQRALWQH